MSDWLAARMPPRRLGVLGWLRAIVKATLIALVVYGGLAVLLALRLVERLIHGPARPVSPFVTRFVCRQVLRVMGLPVIVQGRPMTAPGAMVANHAGWLDVFVLNAVERVCFVAKSEVSGWPGIGLLARATGTLFITRKGAEAKKQQAAIEERLIAGHRLLFFPEGTSSDALRVLPFKSTLFAAFFAPALVRKVHVQPVTVVYHAPEGEDARTYGWWGDMDFAPHLVAVLALPAQGRVEVIFHPEVPVDAFANRKDLSRYCEDVIRTAHPLD
jgi:1-acyl-sn-glycerol-3-phosphate acyltransferase